MLINCDKSFNLIKNGVSSIVMFFVIFFIASCKKDDLIPSYIHIDHITFKTIEEIDKSKSSKITDAWVYLDDDLLGIYELPATFPVLATGVHKITVYAGIKVNGIAKSRGAYPFYESFTTNVDLQQEQTDTLIPEVSYFPDKIKWNEDFEDAGIKIVKYGNSDTTFIKTNQGDGFEGDYSGVATLDASNPYLLCVSDSSLDIPQNQSPVYLELNYKTDVYLAIGMYGKLPTGITQKIETIILNPTEEWNKIYIDLTLTANYTVNTTSFKVYFEASKTNSEAIANVYIDNVKLLYTY